MFPPKNLHTSNFNVCMFPRNPDIRTYQYFGGMYVSQEYIHTYIHAYIHTYL